MHTRYVNNGTLGSATIGFSVRTSPRAATRAAPAPGVPPRPTVAAGCDALPWPEPGRVDDVAAEFERLGGGFEVAVINGPMNLTALGFFDGAT